MYYLAGSVSAHTQWGEGKKLSKTTLGSTGLFNFSDGSMRLKPSWSLTIGSGGSVMSLTASALTSLGESLSEYAPKGNMTEINYSLKEKKLYEEVAARIEQFILQNRHQIGQRLPSEQALALSFNVSRPVIREALKLLSERRLVQSHSGGGTFISKPGAKDLIDMLSRIMAMDNISYCAVFEMRSLLEPYACRLAAEADLGADAFVAMEACVKLIEESGIDNQKRASADLQLHTLIAECSGNPLLANFVHSMEGLLVPLVRDTKLSPEQLRWVAGEHRELVDVIRSKDGDAAEMLMRKHIAQSTKNYLESFPCPSTDKYK